MISRYSTNREYEHYDLLKELAVRNLFLTEKRIQTQPVPFVQTVGEYIDSFHSRNGLSRDRMGPKAAAFDAELKAIISRHVSGAMLQFELVSDLAWGRRVDPRASKE